jgi:hypothetical protein
MFFYTMHWSFTPLFNALAAFPSERRVILKERASGSYRLSAYFMAKSASEVPLELFYPLLCTTVFYWMVSGWSVEGVDGVGRGWT